MKTIYIILGCLSLGLGALGTMLPVLPTVPFLLFAAFCFGKSSERLHTWFTGTQLYKNNLESYVKDRVMTRRAKLRIMTIVTITMTVGFIMMDQAPVGRMVLVAVWLFHVYYFVCRIKTGGDLPD